MDRETLKAYMKVRGLGRPVGVREFQRLMGYNSPGKAKYVLDKLVRLGLANRNEYGKYVATRDLPSELSEYIVLKGYFIPRLLVYAVFSTSFVVSFTILYNLPWYFLIPFIIPITPYYVESIRLLNRLRKLKF